ncbi:MAG: FHA domain-containing protein [Promicromonosporaceae bacterium]|nr:FHA domain-containing protein [Promicromonosporaceae bacterium]
MGELTFNLLRFGFLALLWVFVLSALAVMRRDLYTSSDGLSRRQRRKVAKAGGKAAPAPAAQRSPTKLVVTQGSLQGTSLPLTNASIVIGRQPGCTLMLDDDYSSSRHARIFPQGDQWFVEDLGSTNGTFIGDQQVHGTVPLALGVGVQIGRTRVELQR